ncbi:MAG: hypothetical protein RLZZ230_387 [Candidatus Parcubacteria bacterium]|jgi:hypothetical protein
MLFGNFNKAVDQEKSDNYYFSFFKKNVHYKPMGNSFELGDTKLENADVKTFEVLSRDYAKDKNNAYYRDILIAGADSPSFEIITCEGNNRNDYAKDKNMLYYGSNTFKDLDILSVKFTDGKCGLRLEDDVHMYIVDPENYGEHGSCTLTESGNCVIYPIQDPQTFQVIDDGYSQDSQTGYYKGSAIKGSIGTSLVSLGSFYAKDSSQVYYRGVKIVDADPNTFIILFSPSGDMTGFAKDASRVYLDGLVFEIQDVETFSLIGAKYTKDKNAIYFGIGRIDGNDNRPLKYFPEIIVEGADPQTFSLLEDGKNYEAMDASRKYKSGLVQ